MKINLFLFLIIGGLFITSCTDPNQQQCNIKQISDWNNLGVAHNAALSYAKDQMSLPSSIISLEDGLEHVSNEIEGFMSTNYPNEYDNTNYVDYSDYLMENNLLGYLPQVRTTYDNLLNQGYIDAFERQGLEEIMVAYETNMPLTDFRNLLDNLESGWNAQGYCDDSSEGDFLGGTIAILRASDQWWTNNPQVSLLVEGEIESRILPAWLIADGVGLIAGAAFSYGYHLLTNNDCVDEGGCDVGGGALAGAIFGSTGVVGKVGRWLRKLL